MSGARSGGHALYRGKRRLAAKKRGLVIWRCGARAWAPLRACFRGPLSLALLTNKRGGFSRPYC